MQNSLIIVTSRKPRLDQYTSGQEYCLRTMISVLEEMGYSVKVFSSKEFSEASLSEDVYIHFYYASLKTIFQSRLTNTKASTCLHVYHLEDATWSSTTRLKWRIAVQLAQYVVDKYLVTSEGLAQSLKRLKINDDRIVKIAPFYSCQCNSFASLESLVKERIQNIASERPLTLLYLGRYNSMRVPMEALTTALKKYCEQYGRKINLKIITTSNGVCVGEKMIGDNFRVEVTNEYLSENEKCDLYRQTDIFLYLPKGNVAMNPPITILETVYHGAIPIVTSSVLEDLGIPSELVVRNVSEVPSVIQKLSKSEEIQKKVKSSLAGLSYFYSKSRYIASLRTLVARSE